jgi:hypothetical protein
MRLGLVGAGRRQAHLNALLDKIINWGFAAENLGK